MAQKDDEINLTLIKPHGLLSLSFTTIELTITMKHTFFYFGAPHYTELPIHTTPPIMQPSLSHSSLVTSRVHDFTADQVKPIFEDLFEVVKYGHINPFQCIPLTPILYFIQIWIIY